MAKPTGTKVKKCGTCSEFFPSKLLVRGKLRVLSSRKYCLKCSPFGQHNTKKLHDQEQKKKLCPRCGIVKKSKEFYLRRNRTGKNLSSYCIDCTKTLTLGRQKNLKKLAVEFLGGCCQDCGFDRFYGALEFHHRDPSKKDFKISDKSCRSFDNIKNELLKCDLLCSNCHKERHGREHQKDNKNNTG